MEDKAKEIIKCYEAAAGHTPRIQKIPGRPKETLEKHKGEAM